MTLAEDIKANAAKTFKTAWEPNVREGLKVPEPSQVTLGNEAVHFPSAVVLYADLDQSTALVEQKKWWFAAEIYKTFLFSAAKVINDLGGTIVSYDGDRVMAIFIGKRPCNDAVRCALRINYAVKQLIQPALDGHYGDRAAGFKIRHVVGIDKSEIWATRTGVRGDNDLVWVGNAANLAAKLTARSADYPTWVTGRVFSELEEQHKVTNGQSMWKWWIWDEHGGDTIYGSSWWWAVT